MAEVRDTIAACVEREEARRAGEGAHGSVPTAGVHSPATS